MTQPQTASSSLAARQKALFARLDSLGITYTTTAHPPVATVAESWSLRGIIPGGHCKCLFLKTKKNDYYLAVVAEDRHVDLSALARHLGARRLSFASAERLIKTLGVTAGSVTPFALMNDGEHRVTPLIDKGLLAEDQINFHPLKNDATTTLNPRDLLRFIENCGHKPAIIDFSALTSPI